MELQPNNPFINIKLNISNIHLKNYIQKIINEHKYIKILLNRENYQNISIQNDEHEYASISFYGNSIKAYNNKIDRREELEYSITENGISMQFYRQNKIIQNSIYKRSHIIEENINYDINGTLISREFKEEKITINTLANRPSSVLQESNYTKYIEDQLIENKIIRTRTINYYDEETSDITTYYECDYEKGIFCCEDETKVVKPKFVEISEEKYNEMIKKRNKTKKNMI